ncbi:MAG TPA: hypothetical protein VII34_05785 [Pyrinomonadaceae bacterium]
MMNLKALTAITCFVLCLASQALGQAKISGLPAGAVVVETRNLPALKHGGRALVLWMLNPKKNPTDYAPDEPYPCPDQSRGSFYSGPTRVSLVNSATNSIINTVIVKEDEDSFDVPYAIRKGYYYRVGALTRNGVEAKPTIMWLKDYNGDGRALEFALFDALACMGLETTLIGYSEKQDRVIQYPVSLEVIDGSKHSNRVSPWADYLFNTKPRRPGYWKYEIDYRGRAGSLDKWEVRYNPANERFEGKLIVVPGE